MSEPKPDFMFQPRGKNKPMTLAEVDQWLRDVLQFEWDRIDNRCQEIREHINPDLAEQIIETSKKKEAERINGSYVKVFDTKKIGAKDHREGRHGGSIKWEPYRSIGEMRVSDLEKFR